jgi:hypothetical protein
MENGGLTMENGGLSLQMDGFYGKIERKWMI